MHLVGSWHEAKLLGMQFAPKVCQSAPPWKCLRHFRWNLIEAKILPYYLSDCPSQSSRLSMRHFKAITWFQRGGQDMKCDFDPRKVTSMVAKTTQYSGFQNKSLCCLGHAHCSSILAVKTCMFLPAVKSVVKRGTDPMPLFKDMDSPRLTTDSGQTLIGFVLPRAILIQLSTLEILTLPFVPI